MPAVKVGIAPKLVRSQVENTAAWLWSDPRASQVTRILDDVDGAAKHPLAYLRHLLAAHFATVATFVPTDVDARIRHHAWMSIESAEELAAACDIVDEVAAWDPRWVSARTVETEDARGSISGHDGEWLSVRAGALGRALMLGATDIVDRLVADIDGELAREEAVFLSAKGAKRILSAATVLAHNLGDLSRVVDQWPAKEQELRAKYTRLGHAGSARPAFVEAGGLNKATLALENHRFLALRKPRGLRAARALVLPIGPWFDAWGERLATHDALEDRDRTDVFAALLEIHASSPDQLGCLRALAGLHRATRGGLEKLVPDLPARMRRDALRGRVRDAMDVSTSHFDAKMEAKLRVARSGDTRSGGASV